MTLLGLCDRLSVQGCLAAYLAFKTGEFNRTATALDRATRRWVVLVVATALRQNPLEET